MVMETLAILVKVMYQAELLEFSIQTPAQLKANSAIPEHRKPATVPVST